MRLRPFRWLSPASLEEACGALAGSGGRAKALAGGTDLVPALKLRQIEVDVIVSLKALEGLEGLEVRPDGSLWIGARTRLATIAESPLVRERAPALAEAVGRIAGPQLRNMGTLGGNLCQDTRCRYINQTPLWRTALGGCLKSHGDACHVVPGGARCVAALSSDSVPVLMAGDATVEVFGPGGERGAPLEALYGKDGVAHLTLEPGELVTGVRIPATPAGTRIAFRKWAARKSIDYPLISVAVRLDLDSVGALAGGVVVSTCLGPRPKRVSLSPLAGAPLGADLAARIGVLAAKRLRPLPNLPGDAEYRRKRLAVEVERAVLKLEETT